MNVNETDERIYERYLSGHDENDFRVLLERHRDALLLFINGFVHNLADAEELMLDTFAETAAGRTIFQGRSSYRTWLFAIGKKLALSRLRKNRRRVTQGETEIPDEQTPDLSFLREERDRQLYRAMDSLNPDYRQVLVLLYFEQMPYEEICRVTGRNRKQVYHLAERGRRSLKEILERMGFEYAEFG